MSIVRVELVVSADGVRIVGSSTDFDSAYRFGLNDALDKVAADVRAELIGVGLETLEGQHGAGRTK